MQRIGWGVDYACVDPKLLKQSAQLGRPGLVRPFRQSDEHTVRGEEHVATVGETCLHSQYAVKAPVQRRLDLRHFVKTRLSARAQCDCGVTKHEGGVFYEDGVR